MKKTTFVPNVKMIESLRNLGSSNYDAICDIVDNSVDALRGKRDKKVEINIHLPKATAVENGCIMIIDNGAGMDDLTMKHALTFGVSSKDENVNIGKFGMGLKISAISIGRRFEIISRSTNYGTPRIGIFDLDVAEITNDWSFPVVRNCSESEYETFNEYLNNSSGTIVLIKKLDRISTKNITQFTKTLSESICESFREFFIKPDNMKIMFSINGINLSPILPINSSATRLNGGDDINLVREFKLIDGTKISYILNHYYINAFDDNTRTKKGLTNQGVYVLRNDRQIMRATYFDTFVKHPSFNNYRAELLLTGNCDNICCTSITKNAYVLPKSFKDELKKEIGKYRGEAFRLSKLDVGNQIIPDINIDEELTNHNKKIGKLTTTDNTLFQFTTNNSGIDGHFIRLIPIGNKKYSIAYNKDHEFYDEFYELNKDGRELINNVILGIVLSFDRTLKDSDEMVNDMLHEWSYQLSKLIRKNK